MLCPKCVSTIDDSSITCPMCGSNVKDITAVQQAPQQTTTVIGGEDLSLTGGPQQPKEKKDYITPIKNLIISSFKTKFIVFL